MYDYGRSQTYSTILYKVSLKDGKRSNSEVHKIALNFRDVLEVVDPGLGAAKLLNHRRQVDLHERNNYFGGHSNARLVEPKRPQISFGSVLTR